MVGLVRGRLVYFYPNNIFLGHMEFKKAMTLAEKINGILKEKNKKTKMGINAKLISSVLLDLSHLKVRGTDEWIEQAQRQLGDQQQSSYFTSQTAFNFFRSGELSFRKKYSEFYDQLAKRTLAELSSFDLDRLCILFRSVSTIQLHFTAINSTNSITLITTLKDAITANLT